MKKQFFESSTYTFLSFFEVRIEVSLRSDDEFGVPYLLAILKTEE